VAAPRQPRNKFDRNTVRHSGGGGVLMTGARSSYMDDTKIYTPGAAAAKVAPILNEVTRNTVEHCGKIRYYGGGVHLDSRPASMTMEPGNLIIPQLFQRPLAQRRLRLPQPGRQRGRI
jgi:hypothetical protein